MIRNVLVSNVASYGSIPENLGPLGVINYIYGANGGGKTTISNILRTPEAYNECLIEWTSERKKVLVYNRDFVRDNFAQSESIK
ncbi:AAA family ATPase, partial [Yersinia enterocolitica]